MSLGVLLFAVATLVGATLVARTSFRLGLPVKICVSLGILGAILVIFGIEVVTMPHDPDRSVRWAALFGTMMSLFALLGLLCLTLIWAIRRWGIKHDDNPDPGP